MEKKEKNIDESMIRDYQAIQKTWFVKGQAENHPYLRETRGRKTGGIPQLRDGRSLC